MTQTEDEIEFDIDQFSAPTLSRLYDLIIKHHPELIPERKPKPTNNQKQVAKPKKNKPMSKHEQEDKIAQLNQSLGKFKRSASQDEGVQQCKHFCIRGCLNVLTRVIAIEQGDVASSGDEESSDSEED